MTIRFAHSAPSLPNRTQKKGYQQTSNKITTFSCACFKNNQLLTCTAEQNGRNYSKTPELIKLQRWKGSETVQTKKRKHTHPQPASSKQTDENSTILLHRFGPEINSPNANICRRPTQTRARPGAWRRNGHDLCHEIEQHTHQQSGTA